MNETSLRRGFNWANNIRAKIQELRTSGDASKAWEGHLLELALSKYQESLRCVIDCLETLDPIADKGSQIPHTQAEPWWDSPRKFEHFAKLVKEVAHKADRKHNLKLSDNATPDDYLAFIAKYGNKKALRPFKSKTPKLGRGFTEAVARLCNLTVDRVEANGGLSFLLGHLEQILKLGYYGFTFRKPPIPRVPKPVLKESKTQGRVKKPSSIIKDRIDLAKYIRDLPCVAEARAAYDEDGTGSFIEIELMLVDVIFQAEHPPFRTGWGKWLKDNIEEFLREAIENVM